MHASFRTTIAAALLLAAPALVAAVPAFAHAHLHAAQPADQSTVSPGPKVLTLDFSEPVEPKFCTVAVTMDDGMDMGKATVATDPKDAKVLVATLPVALPAGRYKVTWHAVSVDTHKTDGTYSFTVK